MVAGMGTPEAQTASVATPPLSLGGILEKMGDTHQNLADLSVAAIKMEAILSGPEPAKDQSAKKLPPPSGLIQAIDHQLSAIRNEAELIRGALINIQRAIGQEGP